jgi:hypothetical protein
VGAALKGRSVGISNGRAIYAVGSGHYLWSSPFGIPMVPSVIITTTNQTGNGSGTYLPPWTILTNGSLIAGQRPTSMSGNFSMELPGRNVYSLTASNSLALTQVAGTAGYTTSTNYVTCGNDNGAGSLLIYSLTNSSIGYDLTNITVYGGWADNGRDQQAYTAYYSTVAAPTDFISLAVVNYNPTIGGNIQSATRVTLTSSVGVLATNVAAVKFDFTSPASEKGYCGCAGIEVFGTPSIPPAVPAKLSATLQSALTGFIMNAGNLVIGRNYALQSTTNLASVVWSDETNFMATQPTARFTNAAANLRQEFYRIIGY